MKNIYKNCSKIFLVVFLILSMAFACTVIAKEKVEGDSKNEYEDYESYIRFKPSQPGRLEYESTNIHSYDDGGYITAEDLANFYDILCCQHGTALTSEYISTILTSKNGDLTVFDESLETLTQKDIGKTLFKEDDIRVAFNSATYTSKTKTYYEPAGTKIATPKEAYILADMVNNTAEKSGTIDGLYTYIQYAWWTTEDGNKGVQVDENDFAKEAQAFEDYILEAANVTSTDELKYKKTTVIDKTGNEKTIENAYDINFTPEWASTGEYENVTVSWDTDTQTYIIGPFAINFPNKSAQFGSRAEIDFAGITGMDIYTDASEEPLEFNKDWEFVYLDGERTDATDPVYPKSNEKFYIRLKYDEKATKITNIKTKFRYMNAAGSFERLEGTYFLATWKQKSKTYTKVVYETDAYGNYIIDEYGRYKTKTVYDHTEYWLELDSLTTIPGQKLALGLYGDKWYEYLETERKIDLNTGKIQVRKELVDDAGNQLDSEEFFEFKITVDGALNSKKEEKLAIKAGGYAESQVYYWIGDKAPTYKVEEIKSDGYKIVSIENATGSLDGNKTVEVKAINSPEKPKEGRIQIAKKLDGTAQENMKDRTYYFNIKVTGTFEYNGTKYTDDSMIIESIPVVANGKSQEFTFKWYGENAPTYHVEEIAQEGMELLSLTPDTGLLVDDQAVVVTAVNIEKVKLGSVRIIKKLEGSAGLTEEYINSLEFTFEINVDGYDPEQIKLNTPTGKDESGNWIWEGSSSEYSWYGETAPNYTIKEINVPKGTEFDGSRSQVTGTLTSDEAQKHEVKNNIINIVKAPNTGKLNIIKRVDSTDLAEREYKFVAVVKGGAFVYKAPNGTEFTCEDGEALQLTNDSAIKIDANGDYDKDSFVLIKVIAKDPAEEDIKGEGTWDSGEFSWYGEEAPKYKIEENLIAEDINYSIEPSSGSLSDTEADKTVKITSWNRDIIEKDKAGYLKIIKILEEADKFSKDYVQSLVFKFKVHVDGYEDVIISLDKDNGLRFDEENNRYIWEYVSNRYSWKATSEAPNYSVEEIDFPEGTTLGGKEGATGKLNESTPGENFITTDCTVTNIPIPSGENPKEGRLVIKKEVTRDSLKNKEFKFKVTIKGTFEYNGTTYTDEEVTLYDEKNPLIVKGGETLTVGTFKWYGEKGPSYSVEELASNIANNISVINASGEILENDSQETIVTFVNEPKLIWGQLVIKKILTNYEGPTDEEFYFEITIGDNEPYIISLKAGETYVSDVYKWYITEPAPTYKVREIKIPDGVQNVEITNNEGSLRPGKAEIEVVAENKFDEHKSNFKVKKVVLDEKLIDTSKKQNFSIRVNIKGKYFDVLDDSKGAIIDGTYTTEIKLTGGQTWTSPDIKWWGSQAPTVTVEEYDIPEGWQLEGISNNGSIILEDGSLELVVTNKLPVYVTIDLTTKLAGQVWEDKPLDINDKNTENSVPNGFIDESENAIGGVEVYIYKLITNANGHEVERNLATVYKDTDNTEISLPIVTDDDGTWEAPRVKVPSVTDDQKNLGYKASYDVEFIYDGQTYEPTKFLATSNGKADKFINSSTVGRDSYARDSMALDYNRDEVNNRIQTIEGNTPIDGNGDTVGTAVGNNGNSNLYYELDPAILNDSSKAESKLVTTDENGIALDLFKTKARTSVGGLAFPFNVEEWDGFRLYNEDTSITELGIRQKYWYQAVYNYCLHINLGLVRRPDADMGISKDLYSATIAVKGLKQEFEYNTYRFNTLADITADYYTRQIENQSVTSYQLGLYSTDYYYRAEMYLTDITSDLYDKIINMDKTIPTSPNSEMEVELKYKIIVYNESGKYIEEVKGIDDYYDSTFGEPLSVVVNGTNVSSYRIAEKDTLGSDGVKYNKLVIDDLSIKLASGEMAEIYVTFKVKKATINGVQDTIIAGQKSNVAEVSSYSTFNKDGSIAGKVDKDSAPSNLNIRNYNEKSWYEDDTDAAPVLYLEVIDAGREVSGIAWEDKADQETALGNGLKENEEALIGGLTTELVEKITIDGIDYDFIWPTNQSLNCLGGRSMKDLTGFDSIIETSRGETDDEGNISGVGEYKFEGVPTGNYTVRFLYGNDKKDLEDVLMTTNDPAAYKSDGSLYSGNNNILTANYDNDREGTTPSVYNGQDYKATIYQAGDKTIDSDGLDSEDRRLEIIANSETITNPNANVLATANDKNISHRDLYRDYYMYSDTEKLTFNVENGNRESTTITNIDIGLVERPETAIILDKQISSIKLTTNDGNIIFNALYDINYELTNNSNRKTVIAKVGEKYLVANVTLSESSIGTDVLQAVNKEENKLPFEEAKGTQNFRYINVEDTILQGTTIEINYVITALNISDKDYTSETLANLSGKPDAKAQILSMAKEAREKSAKGELVSGEYLGNYYYTGTVEGTDKPVTTRIRQLVDYVDNDGIFTNSYNLSEDHTWKTTNITELAGNGSETNRILDKKVLSEYELQDKIGREYINSQKTNVILSVDSLENGNIGFEKELVPYSVDQDAYKSQIGLTVTKTVSAQDDANNLAYDNLAEVVKYENTVGRRDTISIPGNANPMLGEFRVSLDERDASATELVTFAPPTGIETNSMMTLQILIVTLVALIIVAIGIIGIKKVVLK